jgi:hypothetical protein
MMNNLTMAIATRTAQPEYPQWALDLNHHISGVMLVTPTLLPIVLGGVLMGTTISIYTIKFGRALFPRFFASNKDEAIQEVLEEMMLQSRQSLDRSALKKVRNPKDLAMLALSKDPKKFLDGECDLCELAQDFGEDLIG